MIIIYQSSSEDCVNTLEIFLIEKHRPDLDNAKSGGGSYVAFGDVKYLYVLLKK